MRTTRSSVVVLLTLFGCSGGASMDVHHASRAGDAGPTTHVGPPSTAGDAGSAPSTVGPSGGADVCGNGLDDDGNGVIDDGCRCAPGETQPCYPGNPADLVVGPCASGTQTCEGAGEFGTWGACNGALVPVAEICGDGVDNDCSGTADDGCPPPASGPMTIDVTVSLDGDCLTASCPPEAPYPVGCNIMMEGGDSRGCVASTSTSSVVYFQEGVHCGAGHVSGTLTCSTAPGAGLNAGDCVINKPTAYYPATSDGCPATWF